MSKIKTAANVDLRTDVKVEDPIKMRSGAGYLCKLDCPELQFPKMAIPWTIGVKSGINGGPPNCKLALKFNAFKDNLTKSHKDLAALLDGLDEIAIQYIMENKKILFQKPKSEQVIRETFTRSIKEDPNMKYTPTVSAKIEFDRRTEPKRARTADADDLSQEYAMKIGCFTRTGQALVPEDVLAKDSEIQAVVSPKHIWVTATGMGITYWANRCVVNKQATEKSGFDFDLSEIEPEGDESDTGEAE